MLVTQKSHETWVLIITPFSGDKTEAQNVR